MATAFRILLWALVVIAPGGILLAPVLAAYELRRRSAAGALGAGVDLSRVSHVPAQL